jgi:hypothetical protein
MLRVLVVSVLMALFALRWATYRLVDRIDRELGKPEE